MEKQQENLVNEILKTSEELFNIIKPRIPLEYLSSDVTIAQLRVMLVLYTDGHSKMSGIAGQLGVALPTVTGIMDNLVKKKLAYRRTDDSDRRVVICCLTDKGEEMLNGLWMMGRTEMKKLLDGLGEEELKKSAEVARLLLANVTRTQIDSPEV
ncbi:MAG: MarR family transcriptional regulator [Dehalococcoidales bacterium]|nr:MarR family transcriptional regulator [Dehalococcoidales bacterium]MDD5122615.1 MarR family transcriptional regulator [Dehalococcoidales bacterium]MDD5498814.1 MarR family transcriptional regulator [Dehalococcoidales bacterium]